LAVADILNPLSWKAVFTLLQAVFPALRCLQYCDMNTPAMDKIALLAHRTCVALEGSIEALNDRALFNLDACTSGLDDEQDELFEMDDRFHDMWVFYYCNLYFIQHTSYSNVLLFVKFYCSRWG
jgi:hypothetical protein